MPENYLTARRALLNLIYKNKDISEDIARDLISFSWTDKCSGESDELNIKLHNAHGRWCGDWQASKGAKLTATLRHINWNGDTGESRLPCGTFEIDETSVSGPPSVVNIKALSVPVTGKICGQAKTKAWQNTRLSQIGRDIADAGGLDFIMDCVNDPEYACENQIEESDLEFFQSLANEAGASVKVTHDKLAVFDDAEYAAKEPVMTLDVSRLSKWSFKNKSAGVYGSCKVKYHDPDTNQDLEYTEIAEPENLGGEDINGRELVLNLRGKSHAELERIAQNKLYSANKFEVTGSLESIGDLRIVAGVTVHLTGLGVYSGKYLIDSVTHTLDGKGGHNMKISIRRGGASKGKKKAGTSGGQIKLNELLGEPVKVGAGAK